MWATYPDQSRDIEPNAQLLVSNRWDVGEGEFGALINFSYTRFHYRDSIRRHGFFIADLAGGRSPDWPEIRYNEAERWRPSVNGALQWRPNADLEFYAEGLWQGFREKVDRSNVGSSRCGADRELFEYRHRRRRTFISGTVNGPRQLLRRRHRTQGFQGATKRDTNTYQFAVGGRYDAGLRISGRHCAHRQYFQAAHGKRRLRNQHERLSRSIGSLAAPAGRPHLSGPRPRCLRSVQLRLSRLLSKNLNAKGEDWQARLDFEYEPAGLAFLPKIQTGVRYVNRDSSRRDGDATGTPTIEILRTAESRCRSAKCRSIMNFSSRHSAATINSPRQLHGLRRRTVASGRISDALRQFNYRSLCGTRRTVTRIVLKTMTRTHPRRMPDRTFDINEKT